MSLTPVYAFLIAALLAAGSFFYVRFDGAQKQAPPAGTASPSLMRMEGVRFYGMHQGRRVIELVADRVAIQRGKVGLFSVGLVRTARFENARIDLYATVGEDTASVKNQTGASGKSSFENIFDKSTFSSLLPAKNITAIEAAPVMVTLHGEKGKSTKIVARTASIRMKEQTISFSGGVHAVSGSSELATEQLVFAPLTARLTTDTSWSLNRQGRISHGTGFSSDLFLE